MKSKLALLSMVLIPLIVLTGCTGLDNIKGIVEQAHKVVLDIQSVINEIDELTEGSELADKIAPQLEQVKNSLDVVLTTIETIGNLVGAEFTNIDVPPDVPDEGSVTTSATVVDKLRMSTKALEVENAKLK